MAAPTKVSLRRLRRRPGPGQLLPFATALLWEVLGSRYRQMPFGGHRPNVAPHGEWFAMQPLQTGNDILFKLDIALGGLFRQS